MTDVLIIGAGPAGLSSGYYLQRAGISYLIVDRADHLGSTWANLYPSLKLNTAGFVSHMPDSRIPLRYGLLPTGKQYYAHFSKWAHEHPLNIQLLTEVRRITPQDGGWCAEMDGGARWYPVVVLASGRFNQPYIPPIAGIKSFTGEVLHARNFRDPAPYVGKRVIVVGSGPSGADIAVALAEGGAGRVWMAIRSDIVIARRNPYGINETIWKLMIGALPQRWQKAVTDSILFQSYPNIKTLGLPLARNRDDRRGTSVPIRGPEFVQAVREGAIGITRGLAALDGSRARLDDSSTLEIDVVIFATGYRPALGYLDVNYERDAQDWPLRQTEQDAESTAIRGYSGLYLVGRYYRGLGAFYNIRHEARKAAAQIAEYLSHQQGA
jgi:putative flavoprotein involved in K+ transport